LTASGTLANRKRGRLPGNLKILDNLGREREGRRRNGRKDLLMEGPKGEGSKHGTWRGRSGGGYII
jgi:hypothetical protein